MWPFQKLRISALWEFAAETALWPSLTLLVEIRDLLSFDCSHLLLSTPGMEPCNWDFLWPWGSPNPCANCTMPRLITCYTYWMTENRRNTRLERIYKIIQSNHQRLLPLLLGLGSCWACSCPAFLLGWMSAKKQGCSCPMTAGHSPPAFVTPLRLTQAASPSSEIYNPWGMNGPRSSLSWVTALPWARRRHAANERGTKSTLGGKAGLTSGSLVPRRKLWAKLRGVSLHLPGAGLFIKQR